MIYLIKAQGVKVFSLVLSISELSITGGPIDTKYEGIRR